MHQELFSFLCGMQNIVGQKESTNSRIAALSDCFPYSSCLLLWEYWNLVPNNTNIHVKETKVQYMAAIQDLVLTFCPTTPCVPQRLLKPLMPISLHVVCMRFVTQTLFVFGTGLV